MWKQLATCLTALILLLAQPVHASWEEASEIVDASTGEMLALLKNDAYRADAEFDALVGKIDGILEPVVDFPYISKLVMGKYYRKANDQQRNQFVGIFRTTLLKTYAKAVVGFDVKGYEILPPKKRSPKKDKQIVTVEVTSGAGTKYSLVYYMRKKGGEWRLVNVVLDGVNLRLTFKNQFADLAQKSRGDVGNAISRWQQQVDPQQASTNG